MNLWRNIEIVLFYHFDSDPRFPPFLLYVRWKSGVTFVRRCFRDVNLCTLALQTLDCHVLSGNNNHNKFILFQRQRRREYINCKVTLLYLEIKASSCFHSFFFSKAITCTISLISIFDQG